MNRKEIWRPVVGYEGLYDVSNLGRVRSLNYHRSGRCQVLKLERNNKGYLIISLSKNGKIKRFMVHRLVYEAFVGPIPERYELDHINTVRDDARLENLRCVTPKENCNNKLTRKRHLEAMKKRSQNEEWQRNVAEANKKKSQDPEWRRKNSERLKKMRQDPEWKRKWTEAVESPEWRKKQASAVRKVWEDPELRRKHADASRKAHSKPVVQIDKETGEVIRRWDCVMDVERELGINHSSIASCCNKRYKTAGNFVWKYA